MSVYCLTEQVSKNSTKYTINETESASSANNWQLKIVHKKRWNTKKSLSQQQKSPTILLQRRAYL